MMVWSCLRIVVNAPVKSELIQIEGIKKGRGILKTTLI